MGKSVRSPLTPSLVLILSLPGLAKPSAVEATETGLKINVCVYNLANVPTDTLVQAERAAGRIFGRIGVQLNWLDYPLHEEEEVESSQTCQTPFGPADVRLRLLIHRLAELAEAHPHSLGLALPCGEAVSGCFVNVFWQRAQELAKEGDFGLATVLGHAIAHEIGHLLLGSNAHGLRGLMRARWSPKDLQGASKGDLLFESKEAEIICFHLRRQGHELAAAGNQGVLLSAKVSQDGRAESPSYDLSWIKSLNAQAITYQDKGQYLQAEPLFQQALKLCEKYRESDQSPLLVITLNNLARLYYDQGKYADMEPLLRRALTISEKAREPEQLEVAVTLENLGYFYVAKGSYAKAPPLLLRALRIREKKLGSDHPAVATSLTNWANLLFWQHKYAEAERLQRRALLIIQKALGPTHHDLVFGMNGLGEVCQVQGRLTEANSWYRQAIAVLERTVGTQHSEMAIVLINLAGLCQRQHRYDESQRLYQQALATSEKSLGSEHPVTATCIENLAKLYSKQQRYLEAEPLYQRALAIQEKSLPPDHADLAETLRSYAALLRKTHRKTEATSLDARAKVIIAKNSTTILSPATIDVRALGLKPGLRR